MNEEAKEVLRELRDRINPMGGDPEVAQVIDNDPYKHGYYSAIEAVTLVIHEMLSEEEND